MIKLAGYKILKEIGSGGMGTVYLAQHEKLEKKVAIKSLHKNLATNKDFRARFLKEAKTHSMLYHSNIVSLLDYKARKDGSFLIMEYVEGMQLDKYIKNITGPIPEPYLINLFTQLLDAVGYAHSKGLIHRDIKPSNIMISNDGRVKILDFGIAKLQDDDKELTKTGVQVGTASYMSPEQVNAEKVDKLTDIYSLGVILFYMAVGQSPYHDEHNIFNIQTKIISQKLPIASKIYPGVTKRIESIIYKATEKEKINRYQSCNDFSKSLKDKIIISKPIYNQRLKNIFSLILFTILVLVGLFCPMFLIDVSIYQNSFSSKEWVWFGYFSYDDLPEVLSYFSYYWTYVFQKDLGAFRNHIEIHLICFSPLLSYFSFQLGRSSKKENILS